ncbi:MAG: DUF3108 domain-containing protein [Planctomycetes bacterium]|nr:DUF3108 domain-containing protein [Planctomycetota bacterium]
MPPKGWIFSFAGIVLSAALVFLCAAGNAQALDFRRWINPRNLLNLSEKASDEMHEEERISEVLSQDADYRYLFQSIRNPDIPLQRYVRTGEELRYQANWRGLPAGSIRLAVKRLVILQKRPVFVFELSVNSNDFLSTFYPVSTNINSYVDAANGRSYLIRRRIAERRRQYQDRLEFKYDFRLPSGIPDPISKHSRIGDNGKEVASLPIPIPGNMQDMVSIIYYIRGMNLKKTGDSCSLIVGGRQKPVIANITVVGEERLTIPSMGTFDCLVVEPRTDGTNLSGNLVATRGGERVWLEKNTLVPVQVSAELPKPMGTVIATLIKADHSDLPRFTVR